MNRIGSTACAVLLATIFGKSAYALTFEEALTRARASNPHIIAARSRILEKEGRALSAASWAHHNPEVEGAGGPRRPGRDDTIFDGGVGLTQLLEVGGQQSARRAAATAAIDRVSAEAAEVIRIELYRTAVLFAEALHADKKLQLARSAASVARDTRDIADRRLRAGDVAVLDLNLARASLGRALAEVSAVEAQQLTTLGELRTILSLATDDPIEPRGDLNRWRSLDPTDLLDHLPERPALQAAGAAIREAEADRQLGRAERWPLVGVGARYERDDSDDVVLGQLSLTIPLFQYGQGRQSEAATRTQRRRNDLDAARLAVTNEMTTAVEVFRRQRTAVDILEREVLPTLEDNEQLAQRSYEVGEISLLELLLVRREMLAARVDYLARLLDSALAGLALEANSGAWQ